MTLMLKSVQKAARLIFIDKVIQLLSIVKTNTDTCPVKLLPYYCKIAELRANSDEDIFRSLQFNTKLNKNTLSGISKPLSYTRERELLLKALVSIGCDKSMLGLHSLRSGGATQAANNNVYDRLFKAHSL